MKYSEKNTVRHDERAFLFSTKTQILNGWEVDKDKKGCQNVDGNFCISQLLYISLWALSPSFSTCPYSVIRIFVNIML